MPRLATGPACHDLPDRKRRRLLIQGLRISGPVCAGPLNGCGGSGNGPVSGRPNNVPMSLGTLGPLRDFDENGVALPAGFSSRIVARTGEMVANTGYTWHTNPDGGATFPTDNGAWIYVSNSEDTPGGVGAIRFDKNGDIVNAYRTADNQRGNCAGGATPWGTWMTCEESAGGKVFESDPEGLFAPMALPAMGRFKHEAVAINPAEQIAYLTEDRGDGGFYRTIPDNYPDFPTGKLQIAEIVEDNLPGPSPVRWNDVPDPSGGTLELCDPTGIVFPADCLVAETNPTREQAPYSPFNGGEGIWEFEGVIYFSTKGDSVVWVYNTEAETVEKIYDLGSRDLPEGDNCGPLCEPDNVTVSPAGDVIVTEDDGKLRLVVITPAPEHKVVTLQQIDHRGSELTGPAFSPDGRRLYFSSQRGPQDSNGNNTGGVTFEITGPFAG